MINLCTQLCRLKIRVGIHTGSLVGGVVGTKVYFLTFLLQGVPINIKPENQKIAYKTFLKNGNKTFKIIFIKPSVMNITAGTCLDYF